jgi:1-deoxy-D-xylulose-5-phosphate reductoisomerase
VGDGVNRIALLGSTGSIGTQALDVVRHLGEEVAVVGLAGGANGELLSRQLQEFNPPLYHTVARDVSAPSRSRRVSLEEMASHEGVDTVLVATSGRAGLEPTLAALRHGKRVALASKEVLVMVGHLVMAAARESGAMLIPVDSEHSAIAQCLKGEGGGIRRLLLTASGGPFYAMDEESLSMVTSAQALAHPVWSMGRKITVDSATLMNKGLEVIEAHWLFDVPLADIDVVVHPECIVHSMVEFVDGSVKAQLGTPDMTLPIQYALTFPHRRPCASPRLGWEQSRCLTFSPVDTSRFRCLSLAREAGGAGRSYPAVLCGADDAAVASFLEGRTGFMEIPRLVARALEAHGPYDVAEVGAAVAAYEWGYGYVAGLQRGDAVG